MLARLLLRLIINAIAIWAAASWIEGIVFQGSVMEMLVVALIFGVVNAFIRPIVSFFALPFIILTLGLLTLVINALMLWLTAGLSPAFHVEGFIPALLGGIIISVVSFVLSLILIDRPRR